MQVLKVALPIHYFGLLDYLPLDGRSASRDWLYKRVQVRLHKRQVVGLIAAVGAAEVEMARIARIDALIDDEPLLAENLFHLIAWSAQYYAHPLGETVTTALPVLLRRGKKAAWRSVCCWRISAGGKLQNPENLSQAPRQQHALAWLQVHEEITELGCRAQGIFRGSLDALVRKGWVSTSVIPRQPVMPVPITPQLQTPNPEQSAIINNILQRCSGFQRHLLYGVTGSGKTLVYLHLLKTLLVDGGQALVLIPEIGLTPQFQHSFIAALPYPQLVLHSGLNDRERLDAWIAARDGAVRIIIGTRSAVFVPFQNLRIIVVDEEHDASYKQQDGLRYHARDVAMRRAQLLSIPILIASATPALESWRHAQSGKYFLSCLKQRAGAAGAAHFELCDIRGQKLTHGLAETTITRIHQHLQREQQVLVFVNRRGFAPTLQCFACGWIATCDACDMRMTLHQHPPRLCCHHCLFMEPIADTCRQCGSVHLRPLGVGTERSEQALCKAFAQYPVLRVDRDTMRTRDAFAKLWRQLAQPQPALVVGTQMIAKGHHFPYLTLVVVMDLDGAFFCADFRASERMGQQLLQVGGRAGRGGVRGHVMVQTRYPQHPLFSPLLQQDYARFVAMLLHERRQSDLPPYFRLAFIRAESKESERAEKWLLNLRTATEAKISAKAMNAAVLHGPIAALQPKRAYFFRFILVLQAASHDARQQLLQHCLANLHRQRDHRVRWGIDVDPQEGY